ncbi:MAG: TonB-dependent receptor [Bacteroidales bacterium]|nr:TonB-dependent receptor [Bacteroidales bacterium]
MNKKLISAILLLALSFGLKAQRTATIYGSVFDSTTGKPMDMVNIFVLGTDKQNGVTTNATGEFTFVITAGIDIEIAFSYSGYKRHTQVFNLKAGEKRNVKIMLAEDKISLPDISIKTENYRNEGITKIEPEWAKQTAGPTTGIENIIKSLGEGTSSNNELSSQYSVRGGNYDENLVYVNDIEIFRPFLIRSGQQEGLSFVNTDMVNDVSFSSGGFDAKYGDKMSSVLDIKYRKPTEFAGSLSAGLLGGSAHLEGLIGNKMTYQLGYRYKTTKRLLADKESDVYYNPVFNDIQLYLTYDFNPKTSLAFLGNYAINKYSFKPVMQSQKLGHIDDMYRLDVYFEGQEQDVFNSMFGSLVLSHNPSKKTALKFIVSAFNTNESESYDIQGEYWLKDIQSSADTAGSTVGIGKYIEHARNQLQANIFNIEHKGTRFFDNGNLMWGIKAQYELIADRQKEWKLMDSAGYSIPSLPVIDGGVNEAVPPLLQNVFTSDNRIESVRLSAYLQREWRFFLPFGSLFVNTGIRSQIWNFNNEFLVSPRASISLKPYWKQDIVFRFATGIFQQSPFYREYRGYTGEINYDILSQKSLHVVFSSDWNFSMFHRPFRFLSSIYYKYLWDLIPYTLDNVRIRYSAQNNAVGYATGIDLRLFGQFIEGIDSWITMSVMQTKEDIDGDNKGYLPRPTDQLFTMNISFQDYLPKMPYCRVYLNFGFGSGFPYTPPESVSADNVTMRPEYMRADIAFTFRIKDENSTWAKKNFMKIIKKIWFNVEWFNVFSNQNVISYIWVKDFDNRPYAVPNYLTPSQVNAKLTFEF